MSRNRRSKFKPPPPLLPPLGRNAQPYMKAGVQLSDEVWMQEYCAGIRDRQIAQRLRQDTSIRRYQENGEDRIKATNHNRADPVETARKWEGQAGERAAWEEARSRLSGGLPVPKHHDEHGRMYVNTADDRRVYCPSLLMSTGTTCARFMNHTSPSGRPVPLYRPLKGSRDPLKTSMIAKRIYRGGVRRVYFAVTLENMVTDAYGKGYDEGLQFERDRLACERLEERLESKGERKASRTSVKVAEAPRVLNMDELVSAF